MSIFRWIHWWTLIWVRYCKYRQAYQEKCLIHARDTWVPEDNCIWLQKQKNVKTSCIRSSSSKSHISLGKNQIWIQMSRRENLKAEIHSSGLSFPPTKVENCISSWKALSKRDFPEGEKSFHFPKLEKRVSLTLGCSFCCAFLADFFFFPSEFYLAADLSISQEKLWQKRRKARACYLD